MKKINKFNCGVALLCAGLAIVPACGNDAKHEDSKEQAKEMNNEKFERKGEKDADGILEAYSGNLYEIRCAENAVTRALTKDVQKLAVQIATAHAKMNADIEALAARKSVSLATALGDEEQRKLGNLTEKSGIDYDREFLSIMIDKHENAEQMYEKLSDHAEDAEVKSWAATVLPEIRSHLAMVKHTKEVVDKIKDSKNDRNTIKNDWDGSKSKLHDGRNNVPNSGVK